MRIVWGHSHLGCVVAAADAASIGVGGLVVVSVASVC